MLSLVAMDGTKRILFRINRYYRCTERPETALRRDFRTIQLR